MSVQCLFPALAASKLPLQGLYLKLQLHQQAIAEDMLIYANYIASLDGRIGLFDMQGECAVPASIANQRDWRLYQELAAQADVMITSARYFRQLGKGCAQDLLPVGRGEAYADLRMWRQLQGLSHQPDVLIVSASLNIPLDVLQQFDDRSIMVATTEQANDRRRKALEAIGVQVFSAGSQRVDGLLLKQALLARHYRSAYMIAGPAVHQMLLTAGVLDRLFLTTKFTLLGQDDFASLLQGDMQVVKTELLSLHLDRQGEQMFAQYKMK